MQILAKYSNLEWLHDLQNADIYIGWAQFISNRLSKMASAEAKFRLGKKTFGIVLSKNDQRMPRSLVILKLILRG